MNMEEGETFDCGKCLLKEACLTPHMDGYGPENAKILLIGEGPGEEEDNIGRPFVGRAGRLLRRVWQEILKFPVDDIFLTNTVRCRPPGNRTPRKAEMKACFPRLMAEIKRVKPEIIIPAGNPAMHMMGIPGKITINGGKVYKSNNLDCVMIPIIHPSAVLQNGRNIEFLKSHLKQVRRYLKGEISTDLGEYIVITEKSKLAPFFKELLKQKLVTFDIETDDLSVFRERPWIKEKAETKKDPRVKSISFCWETHKAYSIPVETTTWDEETLQYIMDKGFYHLSHHSQSKAPLCQVTALA